jgi:hypothetical protein
MTSEMGKTRCREAALAARSTTMICSVAYATEESGSEEKIGSARIFGSSVCGRCELGWRLPTSTRFNRGWRPTRSRSSTAMS